MFIASHASGNLYVYNEDFGTSPNPPVYQLIKQGDGYSTYTCKSKIPRNPVQKWTIGSGGAINQFEFSDRNAEFLATAGQVCFYFTKILYFTLFYLFRTALILGS